MADADGKTYDAFLSYNSLDRAVVEELAARLKAKGLKLYLEVWELLAGREFQPGLARGLIESGTCVTFLGPNGVGPWQDQEIQVAIDRRVRDKDFHVIPVLLPGAERPRRKEVAQLEFLINASWVEFQKTTDDSKEFDRLVAGITGVRPCVPTEDAKQWEGRRPYRGLEAFGPDDAEFFFGRDNLADWLVSGLRRDVRALQGVRLLPVLGPSGSGKSSVVLAGLLPRVKRGAIEGSEGWPIVVMRPGDDPLRNLAAELVARTSPAGSPPDMGRALDLIARLQAEEQALDLFARMALSGKPDHARLLLVVDQFEEVFTYRPQDDQARQKFEKLRAAFIAGLLHASIAPGGKVAVVLTMRSDFLGRCAPFPRLNDLLTAHLEQVGPMQEHELREAIEQPAFKVGGELEPGLAERLLADATGQAGALPLLQFTLDELWTKRRGRKLTRADYDAMGGISGALEHRANAIYTSLTDEDQETCRRIFLRLVQPGEGVEDTKRRLPLADLIPRNDPGRAERVSRVIARLTDRETRLVTAEGESSNASGSIEIAHEALIRGWKELGKWIDANRTGMRVRDRLGDDAREWAEADPEKKDGFLYTGARLAVAREWAATHRDDMGEVEVVFLATSEEAHAEEAHRERRLREEAEARARKERSLRQRFVAVAAVAAIFAVVSGGLGWLAKSYGDKASDQANKARIASAKADEAAGRANQAAALAEKESRNAREKARIASSLRSKALSESERNVRFDRSILLAIEAFQTNDEIEARKSLYSALVARPEVDTFLHADGDVNRVAVNPEGTLLAAATRIISERGVIQAVGIEVADGLIFWDLPSGKQRSEVPRFERALINQVVFSPKGNLLAVVFAEQRGDQMIGLVRIWDVARRDWLGEPLASDEGHYHPICACFAPKSDDVLAVGYLKKGDRPTGCVILWDPLHHKRLGEPLQVAEGAVSAVAIRPDGKTLAAGYASGENWGRGGVDFGWMERFDEPEHDPGKNWGPGGVVMWDLGSRERTSEGFATEKGGVVKLAFRRDGMALAAGCWIDFTRGTVMVRDLARGVPMGNPIEVSPGMVVGLGFSEPSGDWLFGGYRGVYESSGGLYRLTLDGSSPQQFRWPVLEGIVNDIVPLPGASGFAAVFGGFGTTWGGGAVCMLNPRRRPRLELATLPVSGRHSSPERGHVATYCGALGQTLATSSMVGEHEGVVELWDPATDRRIGNPLPTPGFVSGMSADREGKHLAAAIESGDSGSVVLWDVARSERLRTPLTIPEGPARMVAFGGTDQTILAAGYSDKRNSGGVVLWDIARGERLGPPLPVPEGWVSSVAISPDGATLAAVYGTRPASKKGGNLILWDLERRERLPGLRPATPGDAVDLAFSPDGKILAVVVDLTEGNLSAGTVLLYDVKTGRPKGKQLSAAEGGLKCVAFAPDGKTLATGYKGGVPSGVILWDVASRERFGPPLQLGEAHPYSLEYRRDGKVLALGHTRGVSLFDMDVGSWIEKAQRIANRNFTGDEWDRYYPDERYRRTIRSLPWPNDLPEDERQQAEASEKEQKQLESGIKMH